MSVTFNCPVCGLEAEVLVQKFAARSERTIRAVSAEFERLCQAKYETPSERCLHLRTAAENSQPSLLAPAPNGTVKLQK